MAEQEKCSECGRLVIDIDDWVEDKEGCVGGSSPQPGDYLVRDCAEAAKERLKSELALARKALAAAEEMRAGEGSPAELAAKFDAAMAEVRKMSTDE